jgi:hypothetical protein
MPKFIGVEPSGLLNFMKFRQFLTGPVKLRNRNAHTFPKSLFNGAGVNALLLILGQPVEI